MQVFLPYPSFSQSVACLDKSRLGNQIWRECKTLLNGGWANHPVAKMWADYKQSLSEYCLHGLSELDNRKDINPNTSVSLYNWFLQFKPFEYSTCGPIYPFPEQTIAFQPPFIGNPEFHLSHRLNLLWKDPEWYSQFFDEPIPTSKPNYIWPSPQKIGCGMVPEQ